MPNEVTTIEGTAEDMDPGIPGFAFKRKPTMHNGVQEEWAEVKYGVNPTDPALPLHVLEVRRVDMGDQFDLSEIAGTAVENTVWLSLAIVAMSVQTFDGVPEKRKLDRASLRATLVRIGPLGVQAVREGINQLSDGRSEADRDAEKIKAAAGN